MYRYLMLALALLSIGATGRSKICDDIGYLSTSCMDTEILPLSYKDKDVAMSKTSNRSETNITKNLFINKDKKDGVVIKTWMEDVK